jgi:hypothetical protein
LEFNTLVLLSGPGDKIYKTMLFSGKATFEITSCEKYCLYIAGHGVMRRPFRADVYCGPITRGCHPGLEMCPPLQGGSAPAYFLVQITAGFPEA